MLKRARWAGVIVGLAATLAVFFLLFGVVGLPLYPRGLPEGTVPTDLV